MRFSDSMEARIDELRRIARGEHEMLTIPSYALLDDEWVELDSFGKPRVTEIGAAILVQYSTAP